MKILHLTLYQEWFDKIASGDKTEEYREDKPYWQKRLLKPDGFPKIYDEVHFRNGYSSDRPFMRVEWKDGSRGCGRITIHLGKVLEIKNYRFAEKRLGITPPAPRITPKRPKLRR